MRASDLLGADVVTASGERAGTVKDIRIVQDGPFVEGFGHALRIDGILTGGGALAVRLGFQRGGVTGPWPLTALFRRRERRARLYCWRDVEAVEDGIIRLTPGAAPEPLE